MVRYLPLDRSPYFTKTSFFSQIFFLQNSQKTASKIFVTIFVTIIYLLYIYYIIYYNICYYCGTIDAKV